MKRLFKPIALDAASGSVDMTAGFEEESELEESPLFVDKKTPEPSIPVALEDSGVFVPEVSQDLGIAEASQAILEIDREDSVILETSPEKAKIPDFKDIGFDLPISAGKQPATTPAPKSARESESEALDLEESLSMDAMESNIPSAVDAIKPFGGSGCRTETP
ncbi:MAG: hypothetical protein MZW92_71935 [Comamonadaceae bacterium]|nr:hypothetical protein [Comamonadaceae bacterium]